MTHADSPPRAFRAAAARDLAPDVERRAFGGRAAPGISRCHVRRGVAAPSRARGRRARRVPAGWPASVLPGTPARARCASYMAGADVVAIAVGSRHAGRIRGDLVMTFSLDRTIEIRARRATVFRFFTDAVRWARWWGEGSTIDPTVGGAVQIVYPGGSRASGVVRELVPDERIAFTYGYETPGRPIPPGGSLVTITLEDRAGG